MFHIIQDPNIKITPNSTDEDGNFDPAKSIEEYFREKILSKPKDCWDKSEQETSQTTCRVYGKEQVDLTKRNSLTYAFTYNILSLPVDDYCKEKDIFAPSYSYSETHLGFNFTYYLTSFELLRYEPGGFFLKHKDKLIKPRNNYYAHTHMCLLYPPDSINKYEGGDIIFYDTESNGIHVVEPSKFTTWTFIIFPQQTLHEVTPVTKGTRWVFKAPLFEVNKNRTCSDCDDELSS